nr:MAG TPA: hypothetical protein [Caudoviricetes sp.]
MLRNSFWIEYGAILNGSQTKCTPEYLCDLLKCYCGNGRER